MRRVALLVLLGACQRAFGLEYVDAPIDVVVIDAACGPHDEDADGLPDACDSCPFDVALIDGDGDGIPDACDPHPQILGDRVVFFDGFGAQSPDWTATGSAWKFDTNSVLDRGRVTHTTVGGADASDLLRARTLSADLTVITQIDTPNPSLGSSEGIQVVVGASKISCRVSHVAAGMTSLVVIIDEAPRMTKDFPGSGPVQLRLGRVGSSWDCTARRASSTTLTVTAAGPSDDLAAFGLHTTNASILVPWIAVYSSTP